MIYKFQNSGIMPQIDATRVVLNPREYKGTTIQQDHDALVKGNLEHPNDKIYRIEDLIQKEKEANPSGVKRAGNLAVNPIPTSNYGMMTAPNPNSPVKSTVKDELGIAMAAATAPMIGSEIGLYGGLGTGLRFGAGSAAAAGASYAGGKAGDGLDNKLGSNGIGDTNRLVLPFITFPAGMKGANSMLRNAAGNGITMGMPQETFNALRSADFANKFRSIKPTLPAQVKYYGPTMGKSYAAKTNPQLIDLDTWGRAEYDQLAKKYGYSGGRDMILSDKGDYNAEYKQLIKDQIRRIQSDPKYNGQTIIVSNASLLKPNSEITFINTPTIPERSTMAIRNNSRHPGESIEHGESGGDSLQQKGTPLKIDNRFVSEIEGNKTIEFVPQTIDPQIAATTYHFDGRMPLSRPISEAEQVGIPKGERSMGKMFPQVQENARMFAKEYGYSEPTTLSEIKDMYKQHNTFFRVVQLPYREYTRSLGDEFGNLSKEEQYKLLASRGYPLEMRYGKKTNPNDPSFQDEFVFVSPTLEENATYAGEDLSSTVKLQRPFSFRNPLQGHINSDGRPVHPTPNESWPKGKVGVGNAPPAREIKVSTRHLIPVDMAKPTDKGTLIGQYLDRRITEFGKIPGGERPTGYDTVIRYGREIPYVDILPSYLKPKFKQGGIIK